MKKLTVFLMVFVVSIVFSSSAMAFDFGIKGGVNWAKINMKYSDYDEYMDLKTEKIRAFQVGAFFTFDVAPNLSIQPEIYYARKGAGINVSESTPWYSYNMEFELKLHYVEIPVLLKYTVPAKGPFKPVFLFGPYVAHNVKARMLEKMTYEYMGTIKEEEDEYGIQGDIESLDYGLIIATGMEINTGAGKVVLDVRYSHGLANILKYDSVIRNRSFVLMVGYSF